MKKVKITVLRKTLIKDLAEEYGAEGLGTCPMLREGQVFYADYLYKPGITVFKYKFCHLLMVYKKKRKLITY